MSGDGTWGVDGYDTFEGGDAYYAVKRGLASEAEALAAAGEYLEYLERHQPTVTSGGQGPYGIQDRVFVVSPAGERRQVFRAP